MAYVRNADLTIEHIKRLILLCGYSDITATASGKGYVCLIQTPAEEIIGFKTLAHARRALTWGLRRLREERRLTSEKQK